MGAGIDMLNRLILMIILIMSLGLRVESIEIDGFSEVVYTIKVDTSKDVTMIQKLSEDQVFGYETVLDMSMTQDEENPFYAIGVNGGFYNSFGEPAGIMIIEGELVRSQSRGTPLFILRKDGSPELRDVTMKTYIEHQDILYQVYEVNEGMTDTLIGVFSHWYGNTNRLFQNHTSFFVEKGQVVDVVYGDEPDKIPYYMSKTEGNTLNENNFIASYETLKYELPIKKGDALEFVVESDFDIESVDEAFQTGGWLVKEGLNVARDYEEYMGYTTSLQPRTIIGITQDQKLIIKVVDGRSKGVSEGVTGKQAAELLIQEGCIYGAYLDGGSSSTLVSYGELINKPSMGEAKKVAHGLFFDRDYVKMVAK